MYAIRSYYEISFFSSLFAIINLSFPVSVNPELLPIKTFLDVFSPPSGALLYPIKTFESPNVEPAYRITSYNVCYTKLLRLLFLDGI